MDENKKIDLKKYVSPKVSRSYLIRIFIYVALIAGLLLVIYFMRNNGINSGQKESEKDMEDVEVIQDYSLDTTSSE